MKTEILCTISLTFMLIIAGYTMFATVLANYIIRISRNKLLNIIAYVLLAVMSGVSLHFLVKLNTISKIVCTAISFIIALGIIVLAKTIQDKKSTKTETDEDLQKLYSDIEKNRKKRKTQQVEQINEHTWKVTKN